MISRQRPLNIRRYTKKPNFDLPESSSSNETPEKKTDTFDIFSILGDITSLGTKSQPNDLEIKQKEEMPFGQTLNEEERNLNQLLETINLNDTEEEYDTFKLQDSKSKKDIIEQERRLFNDILESYQQTAPEEKSYNPVIFNGLRGLSLNNFELENELNQRLLVALKPTLDYYNNITTKTELIQAANSLLDSIDVSNVQLLKFNSLEEYDPVLESITQHYDTNAPQSPFINSISVPVLFNELLKISNSQFNDGQLTLTLFNYLKQDLNTYLLSCNQETYNIILKTIWIFNGKASISQVHHMFIEMLNNGFLGNLMTFNIIKKIIVDYYHLKMGDLGYFNSSLPIWNYDDEKKVNELSERLRQLSYRVQRQYI